MKKRLGYAAAAVALTILLALLVYQGSFTMDAPGATSGEPYVLWSVAAFILVLAVTLGFMLMRDLLKLYVARQGNREGSRLQTKLVVGALGLTLMPVAFLMVYSLSVLGHNLDRWFYRPAENVVRNLREVSGAFEQETRLRSEAQARWIAGLPEVRDYLDAVDLHPEWKDVLVKYDVSEVLLPPTKALAVALREDGWRVRASGPTFVLLARP